LPETTLDPDKLLAELHDLWGDLARGHSEPLLRACAMTLLIVCDDGEDILAVRRIAGALMRDHPSRTILLQTLSGAPPRAHVFSECRDLSDGRRQIYSEGIVVTADPATLSDVAPALRALGAPDLPVMLWYRGPAVFVSRALDSLLPLAQKVMVDSGTALDPQGAIVLLTQWRRQGIHVADLAWTRLTGWREALAHAFDAGPSERARIGSMKIRVAGASGTGVWYLKRWMERAAPATQVALETVSGERGVRGIALSCGPSELSIDLADDGFLEIRAGAQRWRSPFPETTEIALLSEELSIGGIDQVFEDLLEHAEG